MGQKKSNRVYVSRGVSAKPEWWNKVENAVKELDLDRSKLIRIAVDEYLAKREKAVPNG